MADFIHDAAPVPSERYLFAVAHEEMNSRRRNTMEDCHRILPTLGDGLENYSYFGIYDGHGGRQIVDFLEDAFEQNIMTELKEIDEACVLEKLSRYAAHNTYVC
jgi:serine/threonine protein phosphatase PrpC